MSDDPHSARAPDPIVEATTVSRTAPTPGFCGVSPTSITYWATQWQMEIMDFDGMIGGCDFDASCLPSCWGGTSDWTTWSAPLIQCPCHADTAGD